MVTLRQRKLLFVALLAAIVIVIGYSIYDSYDWPVPEDAKRMKNPVEPSSAALASAHSVYLDKCANCHGDTGKGDGPEAATHDPRPASFADSRRMNAMTDGEIFYRITNGRRPMPAFKNRLTEEQRWQLVLLIRTFVNLDIPAQSPAEKRR
jgi:mono/diheme cytochrome c family protein